MKNMKRWIVLTVMFLFVANVFADNRKKDETVQKLDEEASEEFDYSFMEGVRNNLIGNFKDALGWFGHCLEIQPSSAVAKYEIANLLTLWNLHAGQLATIRTIFGIRYCWQMYCRRNQ